MIQIFINGVYKFNWEDCSTRPNDEYVFIECVLYRILKRDFFGNILRIFMTDKIGEK